MENINEYQVFENQSWLDVSITLYGTPDYAFDLALLNGSAITENINPGTFIFFNPNSEKNRLVLLSMKNNKSIPATAISQEQSAISQPLEGISYWSVGVNFRISNE